MNETLRLLQVEDSSGDAALIVRLLTRAGYDVRSERVEDQAGLNAALERDVWDIIIADHRMHQFDAPDALRILRGSGQDIPFIIVSGSIGEELAVAMMKSGANDYVNKNNLARLVPAVDREIREARSRRDRRQAEERLALAVEATQIGTFDFSPQTGQLIWSTAAKRHFGLGPEAEVCYQTFLSGLHSDDRERADRAVKNVLDANSNGQYASEFRTIGIEDRVVRWISSWGRAFYDPQGKPIRFVGVTLDVTERKKLEDQFRQAQKLESVGRLAGGVAHDFNNLLTIINGYADFMLDRMDDDDPFYKYVTEMRKAGGRATELTQQLLAFSRKQVIDRKPIDINQLVSGSRNMFARLMGEDVELVTRLAPDLGNVFADSGQIHQVLMNLVVNARDAMPEGGRLTIETTNADYGRETADAADGPRPGQYVVLSLADTGVGMDEETRKRIFEPFFTTKGEGIGTGLGLATVYGIVKTCGGWIDVTTAPGQGTRFTIGLPRTDAMSDSHKQESGTGDDEIFATETVLVVEDQDEVRKLALMVLRDRGYRLLEARNGDEALNIARRYAGPIHLLLTDVVMPGMNGKELADRIREHHANIQVLFMSGYSDNVVVTKAVKDGETHYLAKPFTAGALTNKVRRLLSGADPAKQQSNGTG
jgi:PAS domain S-box-containing protein